MNMNPDQLLEILHKENDQRLEKLNELITKIDQERTLMIEVISLCSTNAPHKIDWTLDSSLTCKSTCPACIATRFLTNCLTENDLKLLKGEK